LLIRLDDRLLLAVGLVFVAGHNALDGVHVVGNTASTFLWALLHERSVFTFGAFTVRVSYPLLPWIGTLALGYCCGGLYGPGWTAPERRRWLLGLGGAALAFFVAVRAAHGYGDPADWSARGSALFTLLSFLNVTKYPPSLLYLAMTLGPALLFLSAGE